LHVMWARAVAAMRGLPVLSSPRCAPPSLSLPLSHTAQMLTYRLLSGRTLFVAGVHRVAASAGAPRFPTVAPLAVFRRGMATTGITRVASFLPFRLETVTTGADGEPHREPRAVSVREWLIALGTLAGGVATLVGVYTFTDTFKFRKAVKKVRQSELPVDKLVKAPVERDVVVELREMLAVQQGDYIVVMGEKAHGKSTAVQLALQGPDGKARKGVVMVRLTDGTQPREVVKTVLTKLGFGDCKDEDVLARVMKAADIRGAGSVLVLELDGALEDVVVREAANALKHLISAQACNGVLVLSDSSAVFKLPNDGSRQRKVWVGPFTEREAGEYLDARGVLAGDDGKKKRLALWEKVGREPKLMSNMADAVLQSKGKGVEAVVDAWRDAMLAIGRDKLVAFRAYDSGQLGPLKPDALEALLALLVAKGPDGMVSKFDVEAIGLGRPKQIAPLLKDDQHALVYDHRDRAYRFVSPAVYWAAKAEKDKGNLPKKV